MKTKLRILTVAIVSMLFVQSCAPISLSPEELSPVAPEPTSSPIPASDTASPSPIPPTETPIPTATPLPGKMVYPLESFAPAIPWLAVDPDNLPVVHVITFNILRPPFNSALVRRAFAHAVDREVIVAMAEKYRATGISPATTFTPSQALGRDLYNEVGSVFDPQIAKDLLKEAGYTDTSAFPKMTLIVNSYGDIAPGARYNMAMEMAKMWKDHLGVTVIVEAMNPSAFRERLRNDPPELYWIGWVDENDPDKFLYAIMHTNSEYNYGRFSNVEFDQLVEQARSIKDPLQRLELYILAERILCEQEAGVIPLYFAHYP